MITIECTYFRIDGGVANGVSRFSDCWGHADFMGLYLVAPVWGRHWVTGRAEFQGMRATHVADIPFTDQGRDWVGACE